MSDDDHRELTDLEKEILWSLRHLEAKQRHHFLDRNRPMIQALERHRAQEEQTR